MTATSTGTSTDDAARMAALFGGARANRYQPTMTKPDASGKVKPRKVDKWCGPPTEKEWERHLRGEIGLGVMPPGEDGKILFGCIDVDAYDDYEFDRSKVIDQVYRNKLPLVPTRTKSGGLHLYLFAAEPVEPDPMERALRNLAARLGLVLKEAGGKTEIVTTSNLWMPHVGGEGRPGVKKHGMHMMVGEFLLAAEKARLSPAAVAELAKPPAKKNGAAGGTTNTDGHRYAAKQLKKYAAELAAVPMGDRNNLLTKRAFHMGTMLPHGWIERAEVENVLRVAVAHWDEQPKTLNTLARALDDGSKNPHPELHEAKGRKQTQADVLIAIANSIEFFHTPDGTGFADLDVSGHRETWHIKGRNFRRWLARAYYEKTGGAPGSEATSIALSVIEARAIFDAVERPVHIRVGRHDAKIYLDLVDDAWRAVEIGTDGWRIVDKPPVRFRRSPGMLPLPPPTRGGSVSDLRRLLNVGSDVDFTLVVAWLLAALRDRGPYPVAVVAGEQGSAKSTFATIVRGMIDPNSAPLRAIPREDRDLFIAADNAHVLAFDNVSGLPFWMSDTLCRLASGGSFTTRELYANRDEVLFDAVRPIILNGIEDVVTRPDLADRAVMLTLDPIPDERRRTEHDLQAEFEAARPAILGALLDAVSHGLRTLPHLKLERLPRMADFAMWVSACEGALDLPCKFEVAYSGNIAAAVETVIEADPVAVAVRTLMANVTAWKGTATQLLSVLGELAGYTVSNSKHWPGAAHVLSRRLRRAAAFLRKTGIEVDLGDREGRTSSKIIHITTIDEPAAQSAMPLDGDDGEVP